MSELGNLDEVSWIGNTFRSDEMKAIIDSITALKGQKSKSAIFAIY